jgi:hypothetical protein
MTVDMDEMPDVPDLTGKVVSITIMDDNHPHDLISPVYEMQGGRLFLVGVTPAGATHSDWSVDVPWAVAWDRVTDYFVFNSLEQYQAATKKFEEHNASEEQPT